MTTTLEWLRNALVEQFRLDPGQLQPQTALEDIGVDSLALAELLFHVEEAFGIAMPPQPAVLLTLEDVAHYIDALVAEQVSSSGNRSVGGGSSAKV